MKRLAISAAVLAALALCWIVVNADRESDQRGLVEGIDNDSRDTVVDAALTEAPVGLIEPLVGQESTQGEQEASTEDLGSRRVAQESSELYSGRLIDAEGKAVSGAQISWSPIPLRLSEEDCSISELDEFVIENTVTASSDEDGMYSLDLASRRIEGQPSALWITHDSHEPVLVELPAELRDVERVHDRTLQRASPVSAHVVGSSGTSISGAAVTQSGISQHLYDLKVEGDSQVSRLAWLLRRESTTDQLGTSKLQVMPGSQQIVASMEGVLSTAWVGVATKQVELRIGEPITLGGTIRIAPHVDESKAFLLEVIAVRGSRSDILYSEEVMLGEWGPATVPFVEADEYLVQVTERSIRPRVERFKPEPGESRIFDFDIQYGMLQWFWVANEQDEPLAGAELSIWWEEDGRRMENKAAAREDGYLVIGGLPEAVIEGLFRHPGYMSEPLGSLAIPTMEDTSIVYIMEKGGELRGRCTLDGAPVSDFEIAIWPAGRERRTATHYFSDPEGRFSIDGAPLGDVVIRGTASGVGVSDSISFSVVPERDNSVEVELIGGVAVHGRIVAGDTGAVIPDATVQSQIRNDFRAVAEARDVYSVNQVGEFALSGLARGDSHIMVRAPGYSDAVVAFVGKVGEDLDLGIISLVRTSELVVWLRLPEGIPDGIVAILSGPDSTDQREFQNSEMLPFGQVSNGVYSLLIYLPDGSVVAREFRIPPGRPWREAINLRGDCSVHVEVENPDGFNIAELRMWAQAERSESLERRSTRFDDLGQATMTGLQAGPTVFKLEQTTASAAVQLAQASATLIAGEETSVRFKIGEGDRVLRVVDAKGDPLEGVQVNVYLTDSILPWSPSYTTDSAGECTIKSLEGNSFFIHLKHPSAGNRLGIEITDPPEGEVIELTLDGHYSASFVFSTPDGPLAGIEPQLGDKANQAGVKGAYTDQNGLVTWHNLSEGDYKLSYYLVEFWIFDHFFHLSGDQEPVPVTVYRRVNLDIETQTNGLPRGGVKVDLYWVNEGQDMADHVSEYGITPIPASMVSGADGRLLVQYLPQGDYRWAASVGGEQSSGNFTLEPGRGRELVIEIP